MSGRKGVNLWKNYNLTTYLNIRCNNKESRYKTCDVLFHRWPHSSDYCCTYIGSSCLLNTRTNNNMKLEGGTGMGDIVEELYILEHLYIAAIPAAKT